MSAVIANDASEPQALQLSLALTREVTCIRSMAWRCDLPANLDWDRLFEQLQASGLSGVPAAKGLARFANAGGDELVMVRASGRVQLRVHYTVPEENRRFTAEKLFQLLVYALRRL
jgi:hypothetical protein